MFDLRVLSGMMGTEKAVYIVPPDIVETRLEDYLATDELFVTYLNKYLSLPTFKEKYRFNALDCAFELVDDVEETLLKSIEKAAAKVKPKDDAFAPVRQVTLTPQQKFSHLIHPEDTNIGELATTYDVKCLNTEQSLHWTKESKMPRFLSSSLYSEYRLFKILNQVSIGTPRQMKLIETEPLQTPRTIMTAQAKKEAIKLKIDQEAKEKEERIKREQEMRLHKQQEAFKKLKKAADPTLPGQDELESLNVSLGLTPSDELRDWYKDLKKAQEKQPRPPDYSQKRPTSASSGIVRPGSKLRIHQTNNSECLQRENSTDFNLFGSPNPNEKNLDIEDPVVTRPRSGNICEVDNSETKVGLLHETKVIHEDSTDTPRKKLSESNMTRSSDINLDLSKPKNSSDTDAEAEKSGSGKSANKIDEVSFQAVEDMDAFRNYLANTAGQQMFDFWLELDQCNFLDSPQELKKSLVTIRDKYCSTGSPQVLPTHFRSANNLRHITSFTKTQIRDLQKVVVKSLVTYWAPKFLNDKKQKFNKTLISSKIYTEHHKATKLENRYSYPEPKTPAAIPLRPKTCLPKLDISQDYGKMISDLEIPEKKTRAKSAVVGESSAETANKETTSARVKSAHTARREIASSGLGTSAASFVDDLEIIDDDGGEDFSDGESGFAPDSGRGYSATSSSRPTTSKNTCRINSSKNTLHEFNEKEETESLDSYGSSVRDFKKFIGSAKMETLLQTLKNEFNTSGGMFKCFLENTDNHLWINCLSFWNDLQRFHALYYKDIIDPEDILRKAQSVFSLYIVLTAPRSIKCQKEIINSIGFKVNNPTENLFDEAEEYSLDKLKEPWLKMIELEESQYQKVEQYSVKRPLNIDPEYLKYLNSKGVVKVQLDYKIPELEINEEEEREELYRKLAAAIPEDFLDWTFDELLKSRLEFEYFRKFVADMYGTTDLSCWVDVEGFKRMAHEEDEIRDTKATEIRSKYLTKKYFFGPNSPATSKEQEEVLALAGGWGKEIVPERPPNIMITEVGRYTRDRLERKWLAMFLATPSFAYRQKSRAKGGDSVEDLVMQKKRKQLQLSKLMESKWVSSSKEVIQFRRALLNPITSEQFKKYVRIVTKENFLENDIVFWQEVQKFKDIFQQHSDENVITAKVQLIIACFLESIIHPSVQIDLPPEQVQDILDKRKRPTPYMFREAQLTVFRMLYPHWSEFCKFRHKMKSSTKIESTLERKNARQKIRQKKSTQRAMDAMGGTGDPKDGDGDDFDPARHASNLMDDIIMSQEDNVTSWKYSAYMDALKKQHQLLLEEVSSRVSDLSDNSSLIGPIYPGA